MKIMYVIDAVTGGAPISTSVIANEMAQEKNEVVIVMPKNSMSYELDFKIKKIEIAGFNEFPFEFIHPLKAILLAKKIKKIIQNEKPDIIHAQMPRGAHAIGLLKILNMIPKNISLIYTDRGDISQYKKGRKVLYAYFDIFLIGWRYHDIICLSKKNADYWQSKVRKANVRVISNAAGKDYELYDQMMHKIVHQKLGIKDNKLIVMFAGRMIGWKNWGLAKNIIDMLSNGEYHFIFAIGATTEEQKKETNDFKSSIEQLGVDFTYKINVSKTEMNELYYAADVFVLTSKNEPFGRTAIEAMSRKCVVLGTNVGGLPEVISKNENIFASDAIQFVNRIKYYKNNQNELTADKEWFYKRYLENYTVEIYKKKHEFIYTHTYTDKYN